MKFTIAASSLMFAAHSSAHDEMGILVNSHNKKRYLKKDQNFGKQFKDKDINRNRTKVSQDGPERVQAAAGQVDIAPLQQAVASFVKEEEDPYFGCPPSNIVDCDDGFLRGSGTITCKAACDGNCCFGPNDNDACAGFTGQVCKDKKSCIGLDACKDADIGLVVGGCTGKGSCEIAYIKHGVIRGCIGGYLACKSAGKRGYVGRIKDGCVGVAVCRYMGDKDFDDAFVGFVDNACVGDYTCYKLGYEGRVGFIRNACKRDEACYRLAYGGYVGSVERACIGFEACYYAAKNEGFIGSIKDSCKGEEACYFAAYQGGNITFIDKACLADEACYRAAQGGGYINGISKACLSPSSCYGVAYEVFTSDLAPEISSGITNCVCDTCAGALDDESLPDECGDKLEFVGELLNELEDIIKSKIGN